jgi:hypothetical protein
MVGATSRSFNTPARASNQDTTENPSSFDPSVPLVLACLVEAPTR